MAKQPPICWAPTPTRTRRRPHRSDQPRQAHPSPASLSPRLRRTSQRGTPGKPQHTKAGPPKQGPGDQTRPTTRCKTQKTRRKHSKTIQHVVTAGDPKQKLTCGIATKKLNCIRGHCGAHSFEHRSLFLTVRFFASTCTCKLQRWTRMHPSAKLVP